MTTGKNIRPKEFLPAGGFFFSILLVAGCTTHPTNEQIQQQAARTTEEVKREAQQAADNARVAAAKAEDKVNAVAAGVKQGMQSDSSAPINLNTATIEQLLTLPGMSAKGGRRILAFRPFSEPEDLVTRKLLTQQQFDRIVSRVTTH